MKKTKVAIIGVKGLPAFGGSARAGENMINILHQEYDFTVYTVSSHTERRTGTYDGYQQIVFKKFPIQSMNTFSYYVKAMLHCLFKAKYDIVHVFHIDAAFIIPLLKLKYKVIAGHRARPQESSKWGPVARLYFQVMEYIFYKLPAHIITSVSKPILEKYQPFTKRKMQYIPNGILMNNSIPSIDQVDLKDYILFTSGRIMETKGCHTFLEALNKINYRGLVVIIGSLKHDKEYAEKLYKLSADLDVRYIDLIKDKSLLLAYIKKAKLAVYPTFLEAMSNMLLEIASMHTPLICSNIPENTIVFNNQEALHFRSEDPEDLSIKIRWALDNPHEMDEKAKLAFHKLETEYNWDILAAQYHQLYQQLINQ